MNQGELAKRLRKARLFNGWDLVSRFAAKGKDVFVEYSPAQHRGNTAGTSVICASHKTDPKGPWYNHGQKKFVGRRSYTLDQAMLWASKRYGIEDWATSPFSRNAKVPAEVLKAAREAMKGQS